MNAQASGPIVRDSNITLFNYTIDPYDKVVSREEYLTPGTEPILAEIVDLDLSKGIGEKIFEFNLAVNEVFLAIDSASLSDVAVYVVIYLPNGTQREYRTSQNEPLHLVIPNPPLGRYQIKLYITLGWTRAWIQVTTLNRGVASLTNFEKSFKYIVPSESRYLNINMTPQSWVFLYVRIITGRGVSIEIWRLPEMRRVSRDTVTWRFDRFLHGGEYIGEYLVVITGMSHTTTSYFLITSNATLYNIDLNKGLTVQYRIPYDVELFQFDITSSIDWLILDWSLDLNGTWRLESEIIIINPENRIIYRSSTSSRCELSYNIFRGEGLRSGRYILLSIGTNSTITIFKLTTREGVIDLVNNYTTSINNIFTQRGQSTYYRVRSNKTFALITSPNRVHYRASLLTPTGEERESYHTDSFATLIGRERLLRTTGEEYIIRVQGRISNFILHLRPGDWLDHITTTPDHSDFKFRFPGDIVVLGVQLRGGRYLALHLADISYVDTNIYLIDTDGNIRLWEETQWWWERRVFKIIRYPHEVPRPLNGTWRIIVVSGREGINLRVSQIHEGDEPYRITPYHEYHTFNFNYEMRGIRIPIPASKWALVAAFNTLSRGRAWLYIYNGRLDHIISHDISDRYVRTSIREDLSDDTWIMFLIGEASTNISVSIITHANILTLGETNATITITTATYTITETTIVPTTTYWVTTTLTNTTSTTEIILYVETETLTYVITETDTSRVFVITYPIREAYTETITRSVYQEATPIHGMYALQIIILILVLTIMIVLIKTYRMYRGSLMSRVFNE